MAEKFTKESDLKRLLEILNKSVDHKSLFKILKEEKNQVKTGEFNPDYLSKDKDELESYTKALDEIVTNYVYNSDLGKYVKKPRGGMGRSPNPSPIPKGGVGPSRKNRGGMINYGSKGFKNGGAVIVKTNQKPFLG